MLIIPKASVIYTASYASILLPLIVSGCSGVARLPEYHPPEAVIGVVDTDWEKDAELGEDTLYQLLLAEVAGREGLHDVALKNYEEVAWRVREPAVAERATYIALYTGNEKAVERMTRLWLELASDEARPRQILADMAFSRNRYDDALVYLKQIMDSPAALGVRLWSVMEAMTSIWDQNIRYELMDDVLSEYQQDTDTLMNYAELLIRSGDIHHAGKQLRKVVNLDPRQDKAVMGYVTFLKSQGRDQEMLDWLSDHIDYFADNVVMRLYYARLLVEHDLLIEARNELDAILKQEEGSPEASFARGLLFTMLDQKENARRDMEKAVWDSEWADQAAYYLGLLAEQDDDWAEAERWYRSIEKETDLGRRAGIRLAIATASEDVSQTRKLLKEYAQKYPVLQTEITMTEAEFLTDEGLYEEAMEIYDDLIANKGAIPRFLYARALLAERIDRLDILEEDLRSILAQSQDHAEALNALGYSLAEHTDRYDEAYALIRQALLIKPNNYYVLDSMGWVLYKLGYLTEAREYLQRALDIKSDEEVRSHQIEVLWHMDERQQAHELLRQSLHAYPDSEKLRNVQKRLFDR